MSPRLVDTAAIGRHLHEGIAEAARRHGLRVTSDERRPHLSGSAFDFGPAANSRAAMEFIRSRYGGGPPSLFYASEEDTVAPPNPYRDQQQDRALTEARPVGGFDLPTLDRLLTQRHAEGFSEGALAARDDARRSFERIHDEGFAAGERHERERVLRAFDSRMHAMHELASILTAPEAAYGEDDVLRALRVLGATVGQVIAEWNGDGAVREGLSPGHHDVMVGVDPPRDGESPETYEVRRNLDALERFLRMRLPDRVEPIDHDDPEFVVEVAVHTGMTAEQVEQHVREALHKRQAQQQRGGDA